MKKPCFITFEGIEGAGKSTLCLKLAAWLREQGREGEREREVVVTREPGATEFGKAIRSMVLDPANMQLDSLAELMLFQADRAQHLAEVIRPALARGAVVLCDRFIHSTLAYQGYGRGLDLKTLLSLSLFTTGGLLPDLCLVLDLDVKLGLERAKVRSHAANRTDRFEQQAVDFHQRVRSGFLELAKDPQFRCLVLDATKSPDLLAADALQAIEPLL